MFKYLRHSVLFLGLLAGAAASAQTWPTGPVKIIVPFGAGGLADVTFRIVAEKLSGLLGKQVVIENMPGAGGIAAGNLGPPLLGLLVHAAKLDHPEALAILTNALL